MADGQITKKRVAEPVPNVDSVRHKIPIKVYEEITPWEAKHINLGLLRQVTGKHCEILLDLKSATPLSPPKIYLVSL